MEPLHQTINGRRYVFVPLAAGADGLKIYRKALGFLAPVAGKMFEAVVQPLAKSGVIQGEGDLTRASLAKKAPKLLEAFAEAGSMSSFSAEVGRLVADDVFVRDVLNPLFACSSCEGDEINPDVHFGAHLGDYIPAAIGVLRANYQGAFSDALGGLLTPLKAGAGAVKG